jgi:penicillin-binding protein 1B
VDAMLEKKYEKVRKAKGKKAGADEPAIPQVQAALVAIDPRTGEIKALIGGRDYGQSQLNHALAHRQPGSVFKPFVYAAAFNNAVDGAQPLVTPATTVDDEPTVFEFDGQEYTPNNYGERFMGKVTVRQALTNSLNVATVKVAEMVGYGRVVQIARQMGLSENIRPTPAVALGAYELTPVEVAVAYTAFATMGTRADPMFVRSVVSAEGNTLEKSTPVNKMVLDPRVTYLVDSILKDVLNKGTGGQVRAKGFMLPAAGKTGTSRDGWFAGFTNNLVCVIWIGFDDNHDLGLAGGVTAAPIWADFMLRATAMPAYRDVKDLDKPEGVDSIVIDSDTLEVATPSCPATREEVYVAGSQPVQLCQLHGGHGPATAVGSFLSHMFGGGSGRPPDGTANSAAGQPETKGASSQGDPQAAGAVKEAEKKKGPLQKIFGIFGSKKKKDPDKPPARDKGDSP